MKRRTVLRLLSAGLTGGMVSSGATSGWAQAIKPAPPARPGAPEIPAASVPGVSAKDIRIGMSAAFKGTAAGLGTEFYRGAQAYYDEINSRGGVHGRSIGVMAIDDGYEPIPCIRNTLQLIEKENVFFLSNYVGTPTLTRALPLIKRYAAQQVILVGNFTGAQPQREAPYGEHVFNIRASYRQEMMALVDRFWEQGARKFGVYYQVDAYGRSGTDGVARGLALRNARDLGWSVPIANVSFVGSDAMLALLVQHGKTSGREYTTGLVNSQVVPSYDDLTLPAVVEYRALMERHKPTVPESLRDPKYAPQKFSFISLEGYVNAKVIVEALRRAGPAPTRVALRQALEGMRNVDLGIAAPLNFGPERHQGLDSVYFTRVENGRWVPVQDWNAAAKA